MLGRGIVTDPGLALAIRRALVQPQGAEAQTANAEAAADEADSAAAPLVPWVDILPLLGAFWLLVVQRLERRQQAGRLKQWLNFMRNRYPEAQAAYDALRTLHDPAQVTQLLRQFGRTGW
jgi:tRNA-dihydrouridine synthase C